MPAWVRLAARRRGQMTGAWVAIRESRCLTRHRGGPERLAARAQHRWAPAVD